MMKRITFAGIYLLLIDVFILFLPLQNDSLNFKLQERNELDDQELSKDE